jgi:type IV secretory pathway component VirB8
MPKKKNDLGNAYIDPKKLVSAYSAAIEQGKLLRAIIFLMVLVILGLTAGMVLISENAKPKTHFIAVSENPVFGQSYRVLPEELPMREKQLMVRQYILTYLKAMTVRDHATEEIRYARIRRASDSPVWEKFKEQISSSAKKFEGVRRVVDILSDVSLSDNLKSGVHQVRFKTRDYENNTVHPDYLLAENNWIATITYVVMPELLNDPDSIKENPMGIFVRSYDVTEDR